MEYYRIDRSVSKDANTVKKLEKYSNRIVDMIRFLGLKCTKTFAEVHSFDFDELSKFTGRNKTELKRVIPNILDVPITRDNNDKTITVRELVCANYLDPNDRELIFDNTKNIVDLSLLILSNINIQGSVTLYSEDSSDLNYKINNKSYIEQYIKTIRKTKGRGRNPVLYKVKLNNNALKNIIKNFIIIYPESHNLLATNHNISLLYMYLLNTKTTLLHKYSKKQKVNSEGNYVIATPNIKMLLEFLDCKQQDRTNQEKYLIENFNKIIKSGLYFKYSFKIVPTDKYKFNKELKIKFLIEDIKTVDVIHVETIDLLIVYSCSQYFRTNEKSNIDYFEADIYNTNLHKWFQKDDEMTVKVKTFMEVLKEQKYYHYNVSDKTIYYHAFKYFTMFGSKEQRRTFLLSIKRKDTMLQKEIDFIKKRPDYRRLTDYDELGLKGRDIARKNNLTSLGSTTNNIANNKWIISNITGELQIDKKHIDTFILERLSSSKELK